MPTAKDPDVVAEINIKQSPAAATLPPRPVVVRPPGRKRHYVLWTIFVLLLAVFLWLATSSNPFAEGIRELAGNRHDQAVVDSPFSVSPKNFRYYKFNLPEASTNVAIVGDFTVLPDAAGRKNDTKRPLSEPDNAIEVYVLSEPLSPSGRPDMPRVRCSRAAESRKARLRPTCRGLRCLLLGLQQQVLAFAGEKGRRQRGAALQELDSRMDPGN